MAEAEGILAGKLRLVRADQRLAYECGQPRRHLGLAGCERLHGTSMEDLPLDRAPLEHAPLGRLELVEARAQQRSQRRRDDHVTLRVAGDGQHLLDEQRIAARGPRDLLAQIVADPLRNELVDVFVAQGLEPKRHRPGRAALGNSGRAMQNSRIDAPEDRSAMCSIRSRNVSSPHWMSSKTTTTGRSAAACSSVLRKAQAISSADVAASVSPEQRADRHRGGLVRGPHVELLQHLDHRPVGDPLAVGRATTADHRRVDGSQDLRGEPRLADAGITDDRHQLATLLRPDTLPRLLEDRELALTTDEQLPVPTLRHVTHRQEPIGRNRVGLALQLERFDRLDVG